MIDVGRIAVINYHKIEARTDVGVTARHPDDFAADMQTLHSLGYHTLTFRDILNNSQWPAKAAIITFDDGYDSVYEQAWPMMRQYGFRGVVYVPGQYIGRENSWDVQFGGKAYRHLNAARMRELLQDGFELGSHALSHRPLTAMSPDACRHEIVESRRLIEDITGTGVVSFCYPFGRFNSRVLAGVQQAGYRFGLASLYFGAVDDIYRPLALRRFNIYRFDSVRTFQNKLTMPFTGFLGWRDWLIQKGGLATAAYQKLRPETPESAAEYVIRPSILNQREDQ